MYIHIYTHTHTFIQQASMATCGGYNGDSDY